ncbi:MAG: hypothetical protein ACXQTP_04990 [Candidatus Methanofastidiosia archaeon]
MSIYSIKKVENNVVKIPKEIMQILDIKEGEYIIFKGSKSKKEIVVTPLIPPATQTAELKVLLKNLPGTNANVDSILGKTGINIIFGEGGLVDNDIYASVKLLDVSQCNCSIKELKKLLEGIPEVLDVVVELV